jgi:RHS repeat-associated protein
MLTDDARNVTFNRYDEYGMPQGPGGAGTLAGRFGFTGQAWLPEIGLYYYKARMYDPLRGRFMQTDPAGHEDGPNWYIAFRGDPTNSADPSGTECTKDGRLCRADTFNRSTSRGRTAATTPAQDRAMVANAGTIRGDRFNEGTGYMTGREEGAIAVVAVGSQSRAVRGRSGREIVVLRDEATFNVPREATTSIHRHISGETDGMIDETAEGLGDSQTLTTGRPGYVLHGNRVGVRESIGGRIQHRMVQGVLSRREQRPILENLNRQQRLIDGDK